MHRFSTIIFALLGALLFSACDAASAEDLTLTYTSPNNSEDSLVIEADAQGRVRAIESAYGQGFIILDGQIYVIFNPERDVRAVKTLESYLTVGAERRAQMVESGFFTSGEDNSAYDLEEHGEQTVGQWRGIKFEISPYEAPGVSLEVVVSNDPALADARMVAGPAFVTYDRISSAVLVYPAEFLRLSADIFGRGVPISVDGRELRSISREAIPDDHFELPAPVLDLEQLRERMEH